LRVKDDGKGISPEINFENSPSLGLQLVDLLVKQLNGKLQLDRSGGTDIVISFPKPAATEEVIEK
jgi:two-component sensor histidine kinase